jgi:hypothetical protein
VLQSFFSVSQILSRANHLHLNGGLLTSDIALHVLHSLGSVDTTNVDTLIGKMHFRSEGRVQNPLGRGTRCGFFHHLVDLLEREAFSFRDKEVSEGERDAAESSPHEEDVRSQVGITGTILHQVGSDHSDDLM